MAPVGSSKLEARKRYRQSAMRLFGGPQKGRRMGVLDTEKYLDAVNLARLEASRREDLAWRAN
jgi:hypothetical protein